MTDQPTESTDTLDIHELLRARRQVAVIWSIEDVQAVRSHLSDDQSWEVLQRCVRVHDCEVGFTWMLIEAVADDMYPEAPPTNGGRP